MFLNWSSLLLQLTIALSFASAASVSMQQSSDVDEAEATLARLRRAACSAGDCQNGGFCWPGPVIGSTPPCLCPEGYTGAYCTVNPSAVDYCAPGPAPPCKNGATCNRIAVSPFYSCSCVPGFTGDHCDNIDDCASRPCINGGRCVDGNRTYTCDCSGLGFSGSRCEININDCASHPCTNGLCSDLVKDYNCSCYRGWEGFNCSIDTNYCLSSPCLNGGLCSDGNSTFSCNCSQIDFEGPTCSSKIDDCLRSPCQNGGRCIDDLRNYSCDCSSIDFYGRNCQSRIIDDCSPNPCRNGAACVDELRGYTCSCYAGYSGKNCSIDFVDCPPNNCHFGGICLERSNQALYENSALPAPFNGSFSYARAAGFVCICLAGSFGPTCSVNPDDCVLPGTNQSVCAHASSCTDGLASFTCHCLPGYEGANCSREIDECHALPPPCPSGATCIDRLADFECANCPAGLGGRKCSVPLTGCNSRPCENNASCEPVLVSEFPTPVHDYRCRCNTDWGGRDCSSSTLVSFNGSSSFSALLSIGASSSSADWTFELSFRSSLTQFDLIRLSSDSGLIRVGAHNSSLVLLLLNSSSSSVIGQTKWPISDSLAAADWLTLSVSLTNGSATLTRTGSSGVRQSLTQLVDGLSHTFKRGSVSVRVGGDAASTSGGFRGCVRDLRLATSNLTFVAMETTVESSNATWGVCSRSVQCGSPSPCELSTSSRCLDVWNDFVCQCAADFGGRNCSVRLPSFSFGLGGKASSASFESVPAVSSVFGGDSWTTELRLVTLSPGAFLMLLGDPSDSATTPRLLVTIGHTGRLSAQFLLSNGSQIAALTSSDSVATGRFVSVKIYLSVSSREMSLTLDSSAKSAFLSSSLSLSQPSGQLIIGGFSGARALSSYIGSSGRKRRSVPGLPASIVSSMSENLTAFQGVISAPKLNGDLPLILGPVTSSLISSLPEAVVASESAGVTAGSVTANICENSNPCKNGATCSNVFFNSYSCRCHDGFSGADCAIDFPDCRENPCNNGESCLEKSDLSLYNSTFLPQPFNESFRFASASGFVCVTPFVLAKTRPGTSDESQFFGSPAFAVSVILFILSFVLATISIVLFFNRQKEQPSPDQDAMNTIYEEADQNINHEHPNDAEAKQENDSEYAVADLATPRSVAIQLSTV